MNNRIDTGAETDCIFCEGSGFVLERRDYSTETLGCPDCEGTGRVPFKDIRDALQESQVECDALNEHLITVNRALKKYEDNE